MFILYELQIDQVHIKDKAKFLYLNEVVIPNKESGMGRRETEESKEKSLARMNSSNNVR